MRLCEIGVGENVEGETNALPCVLLIWDGASLPRCGEVEIGGRNDACDEMSSGQTATSVDLSRAVFGGESGVSDGPRMRRQADRLTV